MSLYEAREATRKAVQPLHMMAAATQRFFSLPFGRPLPGFSGLAAGAEMLERFTRDYQKPAFGIARVSVDGHSVSVIEEVALARPFCNLLHFRKPDVTTSQPKLLIVAPLSGHYATLLRGTVESALADHDVFITDWTNARDIPKAAGAFEMDDYVAYVREFLEHMGGEHTGGRSHILSVCQPCVPVFAAVSLMAEDKSPHRPLSLSMMGGPIDTRVSPTEVNGFADKHDISWFADNLIETVPWGYPGAGRRVYPGFMQLSAFMSMHPDAHSRSHIEMFNALVTGADEDAKHRKEFYDEYLSVMDMTAEFFIDTIDRVFKEYHLARGIMDVGERRVNPAAITDIALLTIEGGKDDITGLGQTKAAHGLAVNLPESFRHHHEEPTSGHYGLFNGRGWRDHIYPTMRGIIADAEKRAAKA